MNHLRKIIRVPALLAFVAVVSCGSAVRPLVKRAAVSTTVSINCSRVYIVAPPHLSAEAEILSAALAERGVREQAGALPLKLALETSATEPSIKSDEGRQRFTSEGYRLSIASNEISISAPAPAGVFYGIQTLIHLLAQDPTSVPLCEIADWPDLPLRMVMVDPARQNENFDYYRRLIQFCAKQKLNAILLHLTDDQTAALFEPNYPELMHPHAWQQDEARQLAQFARKYHIQLIPEIESCGHSRMFIRRTDYPNFLHQTTKQRKPSEWMGTNKPGYTNVLCPASEPAYEYIERMITAAEVFDSPVLHLGFDEVDMTTCARCVARWPGKLPEFWFGQQLRRCIEIAEKHGKRPAVWGDMLLKHPALLDGIDPKRLIIYDWQYHPNVTAETPRFFTSRGFEVVACPSLMCSPHIVLPDELDYGNVRTFANVARDEHLSGLNTTFWLPTRYLCGAMWPAFAYAGAQAWSGSSFEKQQCLGAFATEHFGIENAGKFTQMWDALGSATLHLKDFEAACYTNDDELSRARSLLRNHNNEIEAKTAALQTAQYIMAEIAPGVSRNQSDWSAISDSAKVLQFAFQHLQTAIPGSNVSPPMSAGQILQCILRDWTVNRYRDDPNLDGTYVGGQNLAWRFRQLSMSGKQ